MSYQTQIAWQRGGKFEAKVPVFTFDKEAQSYAESLADRSSMIADYRVVAVEASPTHTFVGGKLRVVAVVEV